MADLPGGEVVVYETADGEVRVEVRLERETVWLTQRQMAELFDTTPENVLMHLSNIFGDGELEAAATAKDFLVVQTEGKRRVRRNLKHYNLDMPAAERRHDAEAVAVQRLRRLPEATPP